MEIIIATKNAHKISEIKKILADLPIDFLSAFDLDDLDNVLEDGSTFAENAGKKAVALAKKTQKISLADDSGLEIKALNGQPGIHSARFAGEGATKKQLCQKVLKLMKDVPVRRRQGKFVCVMALTTPQGQVFTVEGNCLGRISHKMRGCYGFGYDPIFIPKGYDKTFAELGEKIKNKISHRAKALAKIKKLLKEILTIELFGKVSKVNHAFVNYSRGTSWYPS